MHHMHRGVFVRKRLVIPNFVSAHSVFLYRLKLHALTWVVVPGPDVVLPEPGVRDPGVHPAAREAVGGGEDPVGGDEGAPAHHGEGGGPVAGAQDGRPGPVANVGDLHGGDSQKKLRELERRLDDVRCYHAMSLEIFTCCKKEFETIVPEDVTREMGKHSFVISVLNVSYVAVW